jgi:hypothetical protein
MLWRHLSGEIEEYQENFRSNGIPAEIRDEHLQDTSMERYRFANPLSFISFRGALQLL